MLIAMLFVGLVSQQWAASQTDINSIATNEPAVGKAAQANQPAAPVAATEITGAVATGTAMISAANTNESPATTTEPQTNAENSSETAAASARRMCPRPCRRARPVGPRNKHRRRFQSDHGTGWEPGRRAVRAGLRFSAARIASFRCPARD